MARVRSLLPGVVACVAACFPDPPRALEDGDDSSAADTAAVVEADLTDEGVVPDQQVDAGDDVSDETDITMAETDIATVKDSEWSAETETEGEDGSSGDVTLSDGSSDSGTVIGADSGEADVSTDETVEPDGSTANDADDVADTESDATFEVSPPECVRSSDCAFLERTCVGGTCDGGTCVAVSLSDVECDDADPCTLSDWCDQGVCQGEVVTCVPLDGCHDVGACDPDTGLCSNPVKPDGSICDDGQGCTEGDSCVSGQCFGIPKVCRASDACHDPGVCDPLTGFCSNPEKPNFTPCDDGDPCTLDDRCSLGRCQGFGEPDDAQGDWVVVLEGDGQVEIHAVAEEPDGTLIALGRATGTHVEVRNPTGLRNSLGLDAEFGCALFRVRVSLDGHHVTSTVLGGAPACEEGDVIAAGLGLVRLADGSFVTGGFYSGGPFSLHGWDLVLGTSQNALLFDFGMWIGRLDADSFAWVTDLLGAGVQGGDTVYRGLVGDALGPIWLATSVRSGGALEVVYGATDSEVILNTAGGTQLGYLLEFASTGRRLASSELTCTGTCGVLPTFLIRSDPMLIVGGLVRGGPITARGPATDMDIVVPSGLTSDFEGWLVAYDGAGPKWGRHFFSDTDGIQKGATLRHAASRAGATTVTGVFLGRARSRLGSGPDSPLSQAEASLTSAPVASYWFRVDDDGGIGEAARMVPESSLGTTVARDDTRSIIVGSRNVVYPPSTTGVEVVYATRPGVWDRVLVQPLGTSPTLLPRLKGTSPLHVEVTDNGIAVAATIGVPAIVGLEATLELDPPAGRTHATIMRIDSRRGLDCE